MNWEQLGKIAYQLILLIIEWGLKICASVAGILTLGAKGSLGMKLGAGFSSLALGLRQLFSTPVLLSKISWAVREYQQLGRTKFQEVYGLMSFEQALNSLAQFFTFLQQILNNVSESPFISFLATTVVFLSFYLLGRVIRFARQKGRGPFICRLEQRIGDRVFHRDKTDILKKAQALAKQNAAKRQTRPLDSQKRPSYLKHIS